MFDKTIIKTFNDSSIPQIIQKTKHYEGTITGYFTLLGRINGVCPGQHIG